MTEFKVISLHRKQCIYSERGMIRKCSHVAELYFPALKMTLRHVRVQTTSGKVRVYIPHCEREGLMVYQIGDAALLEAIRLTIEEMLPDAITVADDDVETEAETPEEPRPIYAIFPDVDPLRH